MTKNRIEQNESRENVIKSFQITCSRLKTFETQFSQLKFFYRRFNYFNNERLKTCSPSVF